MIRASAPGSMMICGEHAVVYGHRAIVAAINQRVHVELQLRADDKVIITSEIADPLHTSLDALNTDGPYRFVTASLRSFRSSLANGVDINITSEIDPTLGFGSSAAVTIAVLGALIELTGCDDSDLHAKAHDIILDIQGRGSGADLAASLAGGVIAYRARPNLEMTPVSWSEPLSVKYAGYKTPTSEVLRLIAERASGREAEYYALYAEMGSVTDSALGALMAGDREKLGAALTEYQTLMVKLGVSDDTLDGIISSARKNSDALAVKISGSGLGDCVLAVGETPPAFSQVQIATEGLTIHG
ncbi:MAG: mevalonate kinase [Pseudomonadota bacterium]